MTDDKTDDNTPTNDETPPAAPTPVEAASETPADAVPPSPPPAEEPPAIEAAASAEPVEGTAAEDESPAPAEEVDAEEKPALAAIAADEAAPASAAESLAADEVAEEAEEKPKSKKSRKAAKTAAAEDGAEDEPATAATATAEPPAAEPVADSKKKWYAVKVQSGREESIKAAVERKVRIEGLEPVFGQIVIPVEEVNEKKKVKVKVKDKKTGEVETTTQERNVVKKIKKFPGYLFAEVEFSDEILYVFRETSGVGDFVGIPARRGQGGERLAPSPMTEDEVQSMLVGAPMPGRKGAKKTVVKLDFEKGDKVRIKNGPFAGHEAEVKAITEVKDPADTPKVTVIVTMWGRPVNVDLDYWDVDKA
jgi:transcription termination/antitermination protein NusG